MRRPKRIGILIPLRMPGRRLRARLRISRLIPLRRVARRGGES